MRAAEAVSTRTRSRRLSLAPGTRSSSCAASALEGSSAVLPTDARSSLPEAGAASTVPLVGAASHVSKACQWTPTCQYSYMYCMSRLSLRLGPLPPTAVTVVGSVSVSLLQAAEILLPSAEARGVSACLQCCCLLRAHPAACGALKCRIPCHLQGLEAVGEREQLLLPLPQLWQVPEETPAAGGQCSSLPHNQSMEAPRPVVSPCAGEPTGHCPQVYGGQTLRVHDEGCTP